MNRSDRFAQFLAALNNAPASVNFLTARELLDKTMNQVEDAHSGASFNPAAWITDGRMYPPLDDSERQSDIPDARLFNSRGHRVYFGKNGAIRIENRTGPNRGQIVLDKPGLDGDRLT